MGATCSAATGSCEYYTSGCEPKEYIATCPAGAWEIQTNYLPTGCNPPPPPIDVCPELEPTAGTFCYVEDTKICSFSDTCCTRSYQCKNNGWMDVSPSCNPPMPLCPVVAPAVGEACGVDPCAGAPYCTYGDCALDSGAPYTVMTCENGAWTAVTTGCTGDAGG